MNSHDKRRVAKQSRELADEIFQFLRQRAFDYSTSTSNGIGDIRVLLKALMIVNEAVAAHAERLRDEPKLH